MLVCDIDMLFSEFFNLRAQGADPDRDFDLNFDNVTFVLNTLDELAGDERFLEIRSRRPRHRVLKKIEDLTKEARQDAIDKTQRFIKEYDEAVAKAQKAFQDKIDKIQKDNKGTDAISLMQMVEMARETGQRRLQADTDRLQKQRDRETTRIERELNLKISRVQDWYKMWAVLLPPIPPLLVGLGVYFNRRAREREGVSKARLR